MSIYITIDGGTTNTRVRLVENGRVTADARLSMGAKDCMGGVDTYRDLLAGEIKRLLCNASIDEEAVTAILASGMLTSDLGLCPLPHLEAPAGIRQLHEGMKHADVGISAIPCYFIPGIKISDPDPTKCDMMRGEESEFFGLTDLMKPNAVCVLPGSHTKHILSDARGQITDFRTLLTGEMLAALSQGTILSESVNMTVSDFDGTHLLLGYDHARSLGINQALFRIRLLDKLLGKSPRQVYSYFLGAILYGDISSLEESKKPVYVGGKRQLRESMLYLIQHRTVLCATAISEQDAELAATRGVIRIFEYKGEP